MRGIARRRCARHPSTVLISANPFCSASKLVQYNEGANVSSASPKGLTCSCCMPKEPSLRVRMSLEGIGGERWQSSHVITWMRGFDQGGPLAEVLRENSDGLVFVEAAETTQQGRPNPETGSLPAEERNRHATQRAQRNHNAIVEGTFGSNVAGENLMRLAGITDYFRVPHVIGGNESWPHCVGQCRTRSICRKCP